MKNILLITFFFFFFNSTFAKKKAAWSINIGGSFPIGSFAKMTYDKNLETDCALFDENTINVMGQQPLD